VDTIAMPSEEFSVELEITDIEETCRAKADDI
jgi:hypothetical protein